MKRLSKDELKKDALRLAKAHKVDTVYATEDGNYFLPNDKSLAIDHNAKIVKKEFENAEVIEFKVEAETKVEKPKVEKPKEEKPKAGNKANAKGEDAKVEETKQEELKQEEPKAEDAK